jgi:tRNA threonylcarbamoyladenosine biosynthesis protein TsaE
LQIVVEYSLGEIGKAADVVVEKMSEANILLIEGEMGAGKTTLIKEICKKLGVLDHVSSPTFSIVNEYRTLTATVYHFDLYRLEDERQAEEIGLGDYLQSGQVCLVEWPEKASRILSFWPSIRLEISHLGDSSRILTLNVPH